MRRALLISLVAILASPTASWASAEWRQSEPSIAARSKIPTPVATIIHASCPDNTEGAVSSDFCAYPDKGIIYVGVNPSGMDNTFGREHELGHLFDAQRMDTGERTHATRLLGIPLTTPWQNGTDVACVHRQCPSELFADAYAACRLQLDPSSNWVVAYDYQPSRAAFRQMCGFISRAAD